MHGAQPPTSLKPTIALTTPNQCEERAAPAPTCSSKSVNRYPCLADPYTLLCFTWRTHRANGNLHLVEETRRKERTNCQRKRCKPVCGDRLGEAHAERSNQGIAA